MLSIRLRYWDLMAIIWLPFKFQLSAVPTVILAVKDLAKGRIPPRQPTKAHRHSGCIAPLSLTSALEGVGWSTPHCGCLTTETDPVPFV
jgi:hypothetical protein